MALEINKPTDVRGLTPVQDIQLTKAGLDLYLGQILKAAIVGTNNDNQVTLNINGQNVNAKTNQKFNPGDVLEVKVNANEDEILLEIQQKNAFYFHLTTLSAAKCSDASITQTSTTQQFIGKLKSIGAIRKVTSALTQQINTILSSVTPLSQLPQQLLQAINKSGMFLESSLLNWQPGTQTDKLQTDFKGQFLKLLASLTRRCHQNA